MQLQAGSSVHAGSTWYDQRFGFTVNFLNLGIAGFAFRVPDIGNTKYQLIVNGSTGYVGLE